MKFILALTLFFHCLLTVYSRKTKCWKAIQEAGYECCEEGCIVFYTDKDGDWGMENGQYCGCGGAEHEKFYRETVTEVDCPLEVYEDPESESKCWKDCVDVEWENVIRDTKGILYYYPSGTNKKYGLRFSCYSYYDARNNY